MILRLRPTQVVIAALLVGCGDDGNGMGGSGGNPSVDAHVSEGGGAGIGGNGGTGGNGGIGGNGGTGGSGGTGGTMGVDAGSDDCENPEPGAPAGTRLSTTGGRYLVVNQSQDHAAWVDSNDRVHVVPLNAGADPAVVDFPYNDTPFDYGDAAIPPSNDISQIWQSVSWVNDTLVLHHNFNLTFIDPIDEGTVIFWRPEMSDALEIQMAGNPYTMLAAASLSPDGQEIVYAGAGPNGDTYELKMQAVATGSTPTTLMTGLPPWDNGCTIPIGRFVSWSTPTNSGTYILKVCDGGIMRIERLDITNGVLSNVTTISQAGDDVFDFILSTDSSGKPDGKYVAYAAWGATPTVSNISRIISLGTGQVLDGSTDDLLRQFREYGSNPFGFFQNDALLYLETNNVMKRMEIHQNTITTITVATDATEWTMAKADGIGTFSPDRNQVLYRQPLGTMAVVNTSGGNPIAINLGASGLPGDSAFSANGAYVFGFDGFINLTPGIAVGTVFASSSAGGATTNIGNAGFVVRRTNADNVAAVMAHACLFTGTPTGRPDVVGDLYRVDVTTSDYVRLADHILWFDTALSATSRVVYSRYDGVFITDSL